jgi:hypothetical protein
MDHRWYHPDLYCRPYDPRFVASPAMIKAQWLFLICVTAYLAALGGCLYLAFYFTHHNP